MRKKNLLVSIVIPNWNGKILLEKNLPQIIKAKKNPKNRIKEIIIVDDGSTDDSLFFIKQNYLKDVKLVKHTRNRGFPAAVNTGARTSTGQLLCLLNTDVFPQADFLEAVIPHFRKKGIFAVSLHEKGYGPAKGKFVDGFIVHSPGKEENMVSETFWANGGSGVFRRNLWMELGGMDEINLSPFYWEDIDLSYRAMKRGYNILWEPRAYVTHKHESIIHTGNFSKSFLDRVKERNQLIFIWKNLTSNALFKKHLKGLGQRVIKTPGYLKVIISSFPKIKTIQMARRKEQKEATVSDEAIFGTFR